MTQAFPKKPEKGGMPTKAAMKTGLHSRLRPRSPQGRERREDIPRMRYRAVRQHPAHVALPEREEVADEHGGYSEDRHHGRPCRGGSGHAFEEYAQQRREGGSLGGNGEKGGGARGRSLIGVRGPEVKGHGRDLEGEARDEQNEAKQGYRREGSGKGAHQEREVRRACGAVDKDDAVEQDGGCDHAGQDVLHPALGALAACPVEGYQGIRRYSSELYSDEDAEEVSHRDEEHRAQSDGEDQGQVLRSVTGPACPACRGQNGEERRENYYELEVQREVVHDVPISEEAPLDPGRQEHDRGREGHQRAKGGKTSRQREGARVEDTDHEHQHREHKRQ